MSHLPRNDQYELFSCHGNTFCFDDMSFTHIQTPPGMFEWLRSQPRDLCQPMDDTNIAFYLQPKLYLLWKLKYAEFQLD